MRLLTEASVTKLNPVVRRLTAVCDRFGLEWEISYLGARDGHDKTVGQLRVAVEAMSHELAHLAVMGLKTKNGSADIALRTANMTNQNSDRHEARTCAVEVLALRALGFELPVENLAKFAHRNMKYWQGTWLNDQYVVVDMVHRSMKFKRIPKWVARFLALLDGNKMEARHG